MSDERTKTAAALDRIALGFVTGGVVVFGLIALSIVVHLATLYPGAATAFGFTVCFVWACMRVMVRYNQ